MNRRSLRLFVLVAAIGSAATVVLDVCSHQAMAASVINLNTGPGSTYSIGYITNTALTTNAQVTTAAAALTASPVFTVGGLTPGSGGLTPALIPASTVAAYGWIAASPGSSWIGPNVAGTASGTTLDQTAFYGAGFTGTFSAPQGFYYYTTTFTLTAPGPYGLTGGFWASDNQGVQIFLNGFALNETNNQFTSFTAFTAPSADFNSAGSNTLSFVAFNENFQPVHGSPQGIDIVGTVTSVPEPTAIVVVASGLPLIGLFWARRRRVSV